MRFALLALFTVIYFTLPTFAEPYFKIAHIIYAGIGYVAIVLLLAGKSLKRLIGVRTYFVFIVTYIGIVVLSAYSSGSTVDIKSHLPYFTVSFLILGILMLQGLGDEQALRKFLKFMFVLSFITGPIVGFTQYANGKLIYTAPYFDATRLSTLNVFDPNYAALPLLFCLLLNQYLLQTSAGGLKKLALYITLVSTVLALALTFSRSGALVAVAMLIISYLTYKDYKKISLTRIFLMGVLLASLYGVADKIGVIENVAENQRLNDTQNVDTRFFLWESAINIVAEQPLLGVGKADYREEMMLESGYYITAHNLVIQTLLQRGVVGLVFLMWLIGYVYFNLFKLLRSRVVKDNAVALSLTRFTFLGFTAYLLMTLTISDSIGFYIWLYLGLTIAIRRSVHPMTNSYKVKTTTLTAIQTKA